MHDWRARCSGRAGVISCPASKAWGQAHPAVEANGHQAGPAGGHADAPCGSACGRPGATEHLARQAGWHMGTPCGSACSRPGVADHQGRRAVRAVRALLVAVHAADQVVDDGHGRRLEVAALLAPGIVQVVGVDHAHLRTAPGVRGLPRPGAASGTSRQEYSHTLTPQWLPAATVRARGRADGRRHTRTCTRMHLHAHRHAHCKTRQRHPWCTSCCKAHVSGHSATPESPSRCGAGAPRG